MKSMFIRTMLVAGALVGGVIAMSGTAGASHAVVDIAVPDQATVGNSVEVQATLRSVDSGQALANTPVVFYTDGSFAGVSGKVELGRGVTDENGVAILKYLPRSAGEHQIRVEYVTPGADEPETATASPISVAGASQLHQSTSGIQVPGLNVWLIIVVVAVVWSLLLSVGLRVMAIARAGAEAMPSVARASRPLDVRLRVAAPEGSRPEA